MFRRHINAICNNHVHFFPVPMRYIGTGWRKGQIVHIMYCPVCQRRNFYLYDAFGRYRRVA